MSMLHAYAYLTSRLRADRRGVTALEYGLIAALIAVVIISAVTSAGKGLSSTFHTIATEL